MLYTGSSSFCFDTARFRFVTNPSNEIRSLVQFLNLNITNNIINLMWNLRIPKLNINKWMLYFNNVLVDLIKSIFPLPKQLEEPTPE